MEDPFVTAAKAGGKKSLKQAKKERQIGDPGLLYDVSQTPIGTPLLSVDKPRRSREARKTRQARRPGRKENRNDAAEPTASA
jgi:hypothetical protein